MKNLLSFFLLTLVTLSHTFGQGRFFNSSMDYSYRGIEWNGDTPYVEHIKDGFKTSKIYKMKFFNTEREWFDIIYMYEVKNLTNKGIRLCIKFNFYDKDGIKMTSSLNQNIFLEPNEQLILTDSIRHTYNGISVHSSDWEISKSIYDYGWKCSEIEKKYYKN